MRVWNGSAWRLFAEVGSSINGNVVQVVSTTKTDTFTTTSTSFVDVTGLNVSITPNATSSKILVTATVAMSGTGAAGTNAGIQVVRDSTAIGIGDAAGSRSRATYGTYQPGGLVANNAVAFLGGGHVLDSPNTTSATTYKIQMRVSANTGVVNRNGDDADNSGNYRMVSTITAMEISG